MAQDKNPSMPLQGEGDYISARKFDEEQRSFAKDADKVAKKAREAEEALDGPEGEELERARRDTATGHPKT